MKYTFSASRVTGGNAVFPDQLIIDDDAQMVTYRKKKPDANTIVNLLNR